MKKKNGFISMALVYTFLIVFMFLMLAILRTYNEKDKFLEAINDQIDKDISSDKLTSALIVNKLIEDNTPQPMGVVSLTRISNFSNANGNGLFYLSDKDLSDEDANGNTERLYFFRGTVDNNNLIYANMCFKILRTNEDGSIRMVYSGLPTSGKCKSMADGNPSIGNAAFASSETINYITMGSNEVYDDSIPHSPIIDLLNNWYLNKIIVASSDGGSYISPTAIYCSNRDLNANINNYKYYAARALMPTYIDAENRNPYDSTSVSNTVSLKCTNIADRYSLANKNLSFPVGLLTATDVILAGGYLTDTDDEYQGGAIGTNLVNITNESYFLYTGSGYWTMSPYSTNTTNNENAAVYVDTFGTLRGDHVTNTHAVIPVISLLPTTRIASGDGTENNPYILY